MNQEELTYPLTLEKALHLLLPRERHADRFKIYREYLTQNKRGPQTVEELLEMKKEGWFDYDRFDGLKIDLLERWYPGYKKLVRGERAKKAAAARWKKKPEETLLTPKKSIRKSSKHS